MLEVTLKDLKVQEPKMKEKTAAPRPTRGRKEA